MKVLLLIPDIMGKGGVAHYYRKLNLHQDCDVTYFHVNNASKNGMFSTISLLIVKTIRLFYLCLRTDFDLAHINPSLNRKSFFRDALFISIVRIFNIKLLVFFRGWEDKYEKKIKESSILSKIFNLTYGKAKAFIVLGKVFKTKVIGLCAIEPKKIYIQSTIADSYSLNQLDLQKKENDYKSKIQFLFISRIVPGKGLINALDVFNKISAKFPSKNFYFNVAGDGNALEKAKEYVIEKRIPNVKFLGYVEKEQKGHLLLNSHILLFPTFYGEGLPNCILESMLYGLVIVSTTVAGIPDAVEQHKNGFLSDQNNPVPYVTYLSDLISGKFDFAQISEANHMKASKNFTASNARSNLINVYNEVSLGVFDQLPTSKAEILNFSKEKQTRTT